MWDILSQSNLLQEHISLSLPSLQVFFSYPFNSAIKIHRLSKLSLAKCFVFQVVFDQKCWQPQNLLHIKQVTGAFSEEFCLSIYQAHTHTQFRVSAAVLKLLLDTFVRKKYLWRIPTSWVPQKAERAENITSIYALPICAEENIFFYWPRRKECGVSNIRKADLDLTFLLGKRVIVY